jgi:hypothetical protein
MKRVSSAAALAAAALLAAVGLPAQAAVVFSFSTNGVVFPTDPVACPDPFAGCELTAIGNATALAGNVAPLPGPWNFSATFSIVAPLSATTFRTTGSFSFDDPSGANNDLSGLLDGVLDATTFQNTMGYIVTGGSGLFAGLSGSGTSLIQIIPQGTNQPFLFAERGQLTVSEPRSVALALAGLLGVGLLSRRSHRIVHPKAAVTRG